MKNKRILISGAGIAGLTLAYWLKHRGFAPTVVEKYPYLRKGGYKVDVRGKAVKVAKQMGIFQELDEARVNLKQSKFVTPDDKVLEFKVSILGYCEETDIDISRWDLVQIIAKKLQGIEVIYGDSITKIDEKVHFEKMEPREFDLVIGADGTRSNVRRLIFGDDSQFIREYGTYFCLFPIPNIFELDYAEIVHFDVGKLVAAYAANQQSFACLAFKSKEGKLPYENLKGVFEQEFKSSNWEVPRLLKLMKESHECYFSSIAQVRMPTWSKGRVALVGDAAHAASEIGTTLAIVGAYVLARELEEAGGDYEIAFQKYEKSLRNFVEKGQDIAESHHQLLAKEGSSKWLKLQLYLMKLFPTSFIQFMTKVGARRIRKAANAITL